MPTISVMDLINENVELKREVEFLKQRNRDLRQKTWFNVYEENLKLVEEVKQLRESYNFVENERMQLQSVLDSINQFIKGWSEV